jgi:hypothetical protein
MQHNNKNTNKLKKNQTYRSSIKSDHVWDSTINRKRFIGIWKSWCNKEKEICYKIADVFEGQIWCSWCFSES